MSVDRIASGVNAPRSVATRVTRRAGTTSKYRFITSIFSGGRSHTSFGFIGGEPGQLDESWRASNLSVSAATKNGFPWSAHARASGYEPALLMIAPSRRTLSAPTRAYAASAMSPGPRTSGTRVAGIPASVSATTRKRPSETGRDSITYTRSRRPLRPAARRHARTLSLNVRVTTDPRSGATFRKFPATFSLAPSRSARSCRRTAFGSWPSPTNWTNRCERLYSAAFVRCALESRCAASRSWSSDGRPSVALTRAASPLSPTAAMCAAPLVWSASMSSIVSSTLGGSMLHPLVVRREARHAHPDPAFEELAGIPLRRAAAHVVQGLNDAVFPELREVLEDEARPGGVCGDLSRDRLLRARMGAVVAEQEGAGLEGEEPLERLQALREVEPGGGGDRDQDLVPREVQARRVARVHAPVPRVEDRELVRRVPGGIEEPELVRAEVERVPVPDGDETVRRDRAHRPELPGLLGSEGRLRARDEPRRIDEVPEPALVHVHLRPRHRLEQEPCPACVVEVDVGDDEEIDVPWPEAEPAHGPQDPFDVP